MKKSNLWAGMLFILGGVVCLAIALMLDTRLDRSSKQKQIC